MEKKSALIVFVVLIIFAAAVIPNLTGMLISPFSAPTQFEDAIAIAQISSEPDEMVAVTDKLSIEPVVLYKIEQNPEEMQDLIVCFKQTAVEKTADAIMVSPTWATATGTMQIPTQIMAILPLKQASPTIVLAPISKNEPESIVLEKSAIKTLQNTFEKIPAQNFEVEKNLDNIPCSIVKANKEGIQQTFEQELEVDITEDKEFKLTGKEYKYVEEEGISKIQKRRADGQYITGKGIKIAIIDSGIDYAHPDLGGCLGEGCKIIDGLNTFTGKKDITDDYGHGTHLAGIAAAVAPEASIIGIKICQKDSCYSSKIAEAIDWCLDNGCNIATLSLGDQGSHDREDCKKTADSSGIKYALEAAYSRGLVIFSSSGNSAGAWPAYPACDDSVVSVGSVTLDKEISRFSNLNPDIYALGDAIESTWPKSVSPYTDYLTMAGTSQAAAYAASIASLYMQTYVAVNKSASALPATPLIEEQFETKGSDHVYNPMHNVDYSILNVSKLIESLIGAETLPSFVCGDSNCSFELGEDAQNCPDDCKLVFNFTHLVTQQQGEVQNRSLVFDVRNWDGISTNARVEIRSFLIGIIKDFNYPDHGTDISPIILPQGNYDMKLSIGSFGAILKSVDLNDSVRLKARLEDLTQKVEKLPELPYAKVTAAYGIGFEDNKTSIICFDRQLSGNNTFVFRCSWNNACKENWSMFMSLRPMETSCIFLNPGDGTAFAIVEIPEAVCGNKICEPAENEQTCPADCGIKPSGEIVQPFWKSLAEKIKSIWPLVLIFAIAIMLVIIGIVLKRARGRKIRAAAEEIPEAPTS